MNVTLKTKEQIAYMKEAGCILRQCHQHIKKKLIAGTTTLHINDVVEQFLDKKGATAAQKGYRGFPFAICASVNEVICHGLPNQNKLVDGDVVTIDIVVNKNGWLADSAWTYTIGKGRDDMVALMKRTKRTLYKAISKAIPGNTLGDVGYVIETAAKRWNYANVTSLIGHGIGKNIHESPQVLPYGRKGEGLKIEEGMVITIEPVFTLGNSGEVLVGADGWSIFAVDGSWGVQYEHTIAVTKQGPIIITGKNED